MSTTDQATQQEVMHGADILVKSLVDHDVEVIFAYPGGTSMPIHQALTRYRDKIRTILPRHEQGGGFAAQGYARTTGKPGVCMATSGPGATNLVTAIADAKLDSIPLIAITGQVVTPVIGSDAFQETPIVEVCRGITKHHYLVTDVKDITRVVREAFHIATTGRPGPVLIDLPKDVQMDSCVPDWDATDEPARLLGRSPAGTSRTDPAGRRGTEIGQTAGHLLRRRYHLVGSERGTARRCQRHRDPRRHDADGTRRPSQYAIHSRSTCSACMAACMAIVRSAIVICCWPLAFDSMIA